MIKPSLFSAGLLLCLSLTCQAQQPPALEYELLNTRAHDSRCFTQGLLIDGRDFIESCGHYGESRVVRYPINTQKSVLKRLFSNTKDSRRLDKDWFAEGLALANGQLYTLSWKKGKVQTLTPPTLTLKEQFQYTGEGWGLTFDGERLIRSDGSDRLFFHHPEDFSPLGHAKVTGFNHRWHDINELEFAHGLIWANLWMQRRIIAIDPASFTVRYQLQLSPVVDLENPKKMESVLNGIAYDHSSDTFWLTGKYWRNMYQIKIHLPIKLSASDDAKTLQQSHHPRI